MEKTGKMGSVMLLRYRENKGGKGWGQVKSGKSAVGWTTSCNRGLRNLGVFGGAPWVANIFPIRNENNQG